tara:strand:+ start:314 stop:787 length:474 start_codon:yes stop_codon:yes gene_type:complete
MGRPFKETTRQMGDNGLWHYQCQDCKSWLPEYRMIKNIRQKFGIDLYCKICKQDRNDYYAKNSPNGGEVSKATVEGYDTRWIKTVNRTFTSKYEDYGSYEDMMKWFDSIGYDTEKSIHQQFVERIKKKHGVELEYDPIHYTEEEPYRFKSPFKEDND